MDNEPTKTKRPSSITIISSFAVFAGILSVLQFYILLQAGVQNSNTLLFAIGGINILDLWSWFLVNEKVGCLFMCYFRCCRSNLFSFSRKMELIFAYTLCCCCVCRI